MPPSGRAKNPTALVANAAMVAARGSKVVKNNFPKTSAEAVPYRKKSYHSMAVPMKLARTTRDADPEGRETFGEPGTGSRLSVAWGFNCW